MVDLPHDASSRLIRSQQALSLFYVTSLWAKTQLFIDNLSSLLDSIVYGEFNDLRYQTIKCIEIFNRSVVAGGSIESLLKYGNKRKLEEIASKAEELVQEGKDPMDA